MRPFGRPGRVWWYQISMRLEVTNLDNPFLLGLTFGALGTSINTVSLWLSSISYQYCYAAAENDSRLGPTWDRLYIYSQRRVTTSFVQTLENVTTQHWKISVYVSMEISVSFVHALQDITTNVHGALCVTFPGEFMCKWRMCHDRVARTLHRHYDDVIMSTIASQITSLTIVYSTIYSGADQSKHQSSASLAFVFSGEFPAQMASNAENVSIWWRHHEVGGEMYLWDSGAPCYVSFIHDYPFCQHGLTSILAWTRNQIHFKVWDEIIYIFPNFNGTTSEV